MPRGSREADRKFILLTIDSLRLDAVTEATFPMSLSVIDEDFATFDNAYSYGVATPFAFPGIIGATHPVENGFVPEDSPRLPELVSGRAEAFVNNGHLSPERGYDKGFDTFYTSLSELEGGLVNRLKDAPIISDSILVQRVYDRYKDLTQSSSDLPIPYTTAKGVTDHGKHVLETEDLSFYWTHYMDPHSPYHPDTTKEPVEGVPSLAELATVDDRIVSADYGADDLTSEELDLARRLYRENVRYLDDHLGRFLRYLREQPWYDDAFIAITSDHGDLFGEHGLLFHQWNYDPYDELIQVPLFVKFPGNEHGGDRFDHLVGHGDLLPTLASVAGTADEIDIPHAADLREPDSERSVVSISNSSMRLVEPDGEQIRRRDGSGETEGTVTESGTAFLESVPFPRVVTSTGVALGAEDGEYVDGRGGADSSLDDQLEALGYR